MAKTIEIEISEKLLDEVLTATKVLMEDYKNLKNSNLANTLEWKYKDNQFILMANDYFQWIDTGRKRGARKVPIEALIPWMKRKNIVPRKGQTYNSVAYAIQQAIFKAGIKARPFTQRIIEQSIDMLSEEMAVQLSISICDEISKQLTFTLGKN